MLPESAEFTITECRRCDDPEAKGVSYVLDGVVFFICDSCGREQYEGCLESVNRENVQKKYEREHNEERRERFLRESKEKMWYDFITEKEHFHDRNLEEDMDMVWHHYLPA